MLKLVFISLFHMEKKTLLSNPILKAFYHSPFKKKTGICHLKYSLENIYSLKNIVELTI